MSVMACSHCMEMRPGLVKETGPGPKGSNIICRNVHTGPREGKEHGSMFPIVLVQIPVPVPIPFPCGVNKPLARYNLKMF